MPNQFMRTAQYKHLRTQTQKAEKNGLHTMLFLKTYKAMILVWFSLNNKFPQSRTLHEI